MKVLTRTTPWRNTPAQQRGGMGAPAGPRRGREAVSTRSLLRWRTERGQRVGASGGGPVLVCGRDVGARGTEPQVGEEHPRLLAWLPRHESSMTAGGIKCLGVDGVPLNMPLWAKLMPPGGGQPLCVGRLSVDAPLFLDELRQGDAREFLVQHRLHRLEQVVSGAGRREIARLGLQDAEGVPEPARAPRGAP